MGSVEGSGDGGKTVSLLFRPLISIMPCQERFLGQREKEETDYGQ